MNNIFFSAILGIFIILLTILCYSYFNELIDFLLFLVNFNDNSFILYLALTFFIFLLPIPTTLFILLNGFLFKENGFFVSYLILIVSSIILFLFSKKINILFFSNKKITFFKKKINLINYSKSNLAIFLSRFLIPFFFHNIYYGLAKIKLSRFMFIILISEIPLTYALNSIGKSLNNFNRGVEFSIEEIFLNSNFYIPFLIIFMLFLIINKFKNKINL